MNAQNKHVIHNFGGVLALKSGLNSRLLVSNFLQSKCCKIVFFGNYCCDLEIYWHRIQDMTSPLIWYCFACVNLKNIWTQMKIHTLQNERATVIQMETYLPEKSFDFQGNNDWTHFGKLPFCTPAHLLPLMKEQQEFNWFSGQQWLNQLWQVALAHQLTSCLLPLVRCRHALETEWRRGGATSFFSCRRF